MFTPEQPTINDLIEIFWKLEEVNTTERALSLTEKHCEYHLLQNVQRNEDGRFIARLPFAEKQSALGTSNNGLQTIFVTGT